MTTITTSIRTASTAADIMYNEYRGLYERTYTNVFEVQPEESEEVLETLQIQGVEVISVITENGTDLMEDSLEEQEMCY